MNKRATLTLRDKGVERLLVGLPDFALPDKLDGTRRWAIALMRDASRWQMAKRQRGLFGRAEV